ncbi:MAG: efflux RND transporter periplasmic adaptor subunit, partial [Bryobacteraceae bacterium]
QDQVELLRARYSVRRAELEVKRNELLPAIDAKKNLLNLEEARRRLSQLESDIKSRLQQAEAEMAVLRETKNKARLELSRERQRLMQVRMLSPISGLVAIKQNRQGRFFPGMQIPDIREGDQLQPGIPVADILDLSELEVVAKIGELDRASLKEGQEVLVRLDAMGDRDFHGKIKSMSGTASANIFSGDPAKKFDVVFSVDMKELLSGLGAKPDQIKKVLATAAQNRKKPAPPPVSTGRGAPGMAGGPQGAGGGAPGAGGGAPGGGSPGGGAPGMMRRASGEAPAGVGPAEGAGGGRAGMSEEDRKKMQEAMQKALNGRQMQDLTPEERQKVLAEVRKAVPAAAAARGQQGGRVGRPGGMLAGILSAPTSRYSEKELANAQLPPPPEEGNQLDVLIRPGLLADVEIILESIPDAINIPAQSVFEKDGKQIVYVKEGNRWEERPIKPSKRTESIMIIAEGLKPGEIVAMSDPNAKPTDNKPAGGSPMGIASSGGAR